MTITETRLKQAADRAMSHAAAASGIVKALNAIAQSGLITDEQFLKVAGMAPDVLPRMVEMASEDFVCAKDTYECVCRDLGVPAYATYNED